MNFPLTQPPESCRLYSSAFRRLGPRRLATGVYGGCPPLMGHPAWPMGEEMDDCFSPTNWNKFQHYKHRRPPWIRLYTDLIDQPEYWALSLRAQAILPAIWMLASRYDGASIPIAHIDDMAYRCRCDVQEFRACLQELKNNGFIEDASGALARCLHDASKVLFQSRDRDRDISLASLARATDEQARQDFGTSGEEPDPSPDDSDALGGLPVAETPAMAELPPRKRLRFDQSESGGAPVPPKSRRGPQKPKSDEVEPEGFQEFWSEYPKGKPRQPALKSWRSLAPDPELRQKIMAGLEAHKRSKQWQDPQYIPHPATWLNQRRWEDEVGAPAAAKAKPDYSPEAAIRAGFKPISGSTNVFTW